MRLFLAVVAALLICSLMLTTSVFAANVTGSLPTLSAKSAILIDGCEGDVIYEKNAKERMGMASTTKIMTALVVAQKLPLDKRIVIPKEAVNVEGSSVYLTEGEILTVRELLCALMLASANDAAVALAIATAGSVEAFAELMNASVDKMGLCDTHFVNPHGLYDEQHYTTAYDLARIAACALENPAIREIASTQKVTIPQGVTDSSPSGASSRYLKNHNKMLWLYDGAIGLKTGFTKKTGRCLVSAAERDGLMLVAVTLSAPDDWRDHTEMLDYGYSLYERVTLLDAGEYTYQYAVCGGRGQYVTLTNKESVVMTLKKDRKKEELFVYSMHRFEFAPIKEGAELAYLTVRCEGKEQIVSLVAAYSVERATKGR